MSLFKLTPPKKPTVWLLNIVMVAFVCFFGTSWFVWEANMFIAHEKSWKVKVQFPILLLILIVAEKSTHISI